LVKEVILVDDFSDFGTFPFPPLSLPLIVFSTEHLKDQLQEFVDGQPKVRLVRAKRREGLIRARLLGASVAEGSVLTFLDSHCECTMGWLEPLLDRIAQNISNVVTPVIDVINDDTIQYQYSSAKSTSVGGFDWNLQFNWHGIPDHEKKRRKRDIDPVRRVVLIAC
jgi:polypeptide N-acetylgalactosaminyltransferase